MLPNLKQRLAMTLAIIAGGALLVWRQSWLLPADGSPGLVMLDSRLGPVMAWLALVALLAPVAAMGLVVSAMGNRLGGVFATAAALAVLAIAAGPADGWYGRAELPTGYWPLAIEALLWAGLWALLLALIDRLSPPVAGGLPRVISSDRPSHATRFHLPGGQGLIGCVIAAALGGVVSNVLLRSSDVGQVTGALIVGFTVGGVVARASVPSASPTAIVLSPMLAAMVGYGYLATRFITRDAVLAAKYQDALLGLGLALPIHYAAAGVAGAAIGLGLGHSLEHNAQQEKQTPAEPHASR